MKIRHLLACVLLFAGAAFTQNNPVYITAANQCATVSTTAQATVGFQLTGTWSATLTPAVQVGSNNTYVSISVFPMGSTTSQATVTANGAYYANVAGSTSFQLCATAFTSGTINVYMYATIAFVPPSGGGGALPTGLTFAAPTLTVSTAGSGNGTVAFSGNTSGTCSFSVDATSTTLTDNCDLVTSSNGSATAPAFALGASGGLFYTSTVPGWVLNGKAANTDMIGFNTNSSSVALAIHANGGFAWSSSNTSMSGSGSFGADTALWRQAAALVSVGSSTAQSETGLLRSGNSCAVSSDITLTVNTAVTVCSFSLPAIAKVWIVHCSLPWAITAGTGTNTIAIGVNPSQTPGATTNFTGTIYSAAATAPVFAVTPVSASGATSIETSGTITPGATLFPAYLDGTLSASATAGTFVVTMTAAGTTATAAAKAGAFCRLE